MPETETTKPEITPTAQLDALLGDTQAKSLTVMDADGVEHSFPVETFSTYKTGQVLRLIGQIQTQTDIMAVFNAVTTPIQTHVLLCPHCRAPLDWSRDDNLPLSENETKQNTGIKVGCNAPNCGLPYFLKDGVIDPLPAERVEAQKQARASALSSLLTIAPDLLIDFGAIAILSNKELEEAYDSKEGIAPLVAKNKRWLNFKCNADVPLAILGAYLPALGIDFLLDGVKTLNLAVLTLQLAPKARTSKKSSG